MPNLSDLNKTDLEDRKRGLEDFSSVLKDLQIPFMLCDGVLLGAVREGNFIQWDWNVELSSKIENIFDKSDRLLELLKDQGFDIVHVNLEWENYKITASKFKNQYTLIGFYKKGALRVRSTWAYPCIFFDNLEGNDLDCYNFLLTQIFYKNKKQIFVI